MTEIEKKIQEILAEHHECRWMDTSDLEGYLRRIAAEQKAIDDAELAEVKRQRDEYYDELLKLRMQKVEIIGKAWRWIELYRNMYVHWTMEQMKNHFINAMEE